MRKREKTRWWGNEWKKEVDRVSGVTFYSLLHAQPKVKSKNSRDVSTGSSLGRNFTFKASISKLDAYRRLPIYWQGLLPSSHFYLGLHLGLLRSTQVYSDLLILFIKILFIEIVVDLVITFCGLSQN